MQGRKAKARTAVLGALALRSVNGSEWTYVLDLMHDTGLRSGRVYVALSDLEEDGEVKAKWAWLEPGRAHRRRMYALAYPDAQA